MDNDPVRNDRVFSCALPNIYPYSTQLSSSHRNEVLRGTTMKMVFQAFLTAASLTITMGCTAAVLMAPMFDAPAFLQLGN